VLLDYAVGTFAILAIVAFVAAVFIITGAPKPYEMQALGAAYTDVLLKVEQSVHGLRADFCANADAETVAQSKCETQASAKAAAL